MESKTVTINVPAAVEKAMREVAKEERRSLSAQIAVALEQWIKDRKEEK